MKINPFSLTEKVQFYVEIIHALGFLDSGFPAFIHKYEGQIAFSKIENCIIGLLQKKRIYVKYQTAWDKITYVNPHWKALEQRVCVTDFYKWNSNITSVIVIFYTPKSYKLSIYLIYT